MKTKLLLGSVCILVSFAYLQIATVEASGGAKKVLFIGDSITRSGPTPDIGWSGDYGMAATSASNDYAHLLYAKIAGAQTSTPALTVQGSYNGKIAGALSALSSLAAVGADLVVIQIGENDIDLTKDQFESQYESLAAGLKNATSGVRLYCVSAWKDSAERGGRDASIRKICERQGGVFVDISAIANNPIYSALAEGRFTHDGINWHPGNAGMQAYADTLWGVMKNALQDPVQNPTETCYPDLTCQANTCTNSTCKETKCGWELNGTKICGDASETCSGDGGCLAYKPDYANEVAGTCAEGLKCYDCFSGRFNGSGCDSVKCNGDCTGDTYECDDGLICYNKKCRKPANPDDATCSGTALPGGGDSSPDDGCIEAFQPFYCANLWITGDKETYKCCKTPTPPQSGCECSGNPGDPFSAIIYCPSGQTCQNCQCVTSAGNPSPAMPSLSASVTSGTAPLNDVNFTLTNGTGCINYMCGVGFGASKYEYEKSFSCSYPTAGTYVASIECAGSKIEKTISVTDSGNQNPKGELGQTPGKPTVSPASGTNFTVSSGEFGMVTIASNNASSIFHTLKYTTDGSTPADPSIPVTTSADGSFMGYNGGCSGGCDHYDISLPYKSGQETKYKILVKARNSYGDGPVSDVFSYSVKSNTSPENPTSPTCTASFSASTTSAGVSSLSLTAPATAYLSFNSSGADKLMVSCTGQFPLTPAVEVPPAYSNYPFPFTSTQTGTETCTFVPYKNGVAGTTSCKASVIVSKAPAQPTGTCECSVNSPFSGGSSCASGTTCDGCHCITSSSVVNGACDNSTNGQVLSSAPTTNLCTKGSASTVSGTGPWNWSCSGSNGGTTANCSATKSGTTPSGSVCGTAANSNYACSATETSGTLCSSGSTCYPNTGYPPSPCPTNIALSGSSAQWYCGNANCYAKKLSSCQTPTSGDIKPLPETSYKSLWQFQYTYDSDGKKNMLGYKNVNDPAKFTNTTTTEMAIYAPYNYNCADADYARSNNIRSCDYSAEDMLTTKIYLAPGTRNTLIFTKSQGSSSNAIVMMRFGEPPQGTYSMDSLNKDYPYKDAVSMDDVTGKDFVARRTTSGLEHIFDGKLSDDSPGGWLYLRIIPISSTLHYISYQGYRDFAKYKTWYDNMTANNGWDAYGDPGNGSLGVKVDGACDNSTNGQALSSAPTTNLCTKGSTSTVSGTGPWNWSCSGSNGGTPANCSATKNGGTPNQPNSMYKSITQFQQSSCNRDSAGYCSSYTSKKTGFKNLYPPSTDSSQNKQSLYMGAMGYGAASNSMQISYSESELEYFKVYFPPSSTNVDITLYNGQDPHPAGSYLYAVARFGESPTGDYSDINQLKAKAKYGKGKLSDITGQDYITTYSGGITNIFGDVLNANTGIKFQGGWVYVRIIRSDTSIHSISASSHIDNLQDYTTWYNTMTISNSWLPDGDPGEQAPAPVCSETCTGGNFTCQATAPANSTVSSNTCCGGKTCYQCSSGYYWNTEACSPLNSSCSLSAKLTASTQNDPFVTKLKTELTASSGTVKCDSQDCDGGIISNKENNGCNFTCTYNNSGEYNPSLHVADSACAKNPTTKITIASAPDPATGSDCAKETCKEVSCNSKNGSTNPWIKGTKTEGCATVTVKASPDSLTVPDKTYLTWTSSGASRMEAECVTGPVTINRGASFVSDTDCAKSGLIDKCTDKGYELSFASNQTGTEICTFYPTNSSNGLPGTPSSVTILAKEKVTSTPSCTGTTPTNAITCPDDKLNLTTDLSWISIGHSVAECSNERKCEYYTLANSNNITGYVCKPDNANCAANTCQDVYCDDGCNRIKGTNSCLMFP